MRIDNHIKNGSHVQQGERIGKIETNSFAANCNMDCDKRDQSQEIASGPHLHMELFKNQERESLNDKEFSGIIIKAGIYNMDLDGVNLASHCNFSTDCTKAVDMNNNERYCATRFVDKRDSSNIYCPSVVGANNGKLYNP